ncbi:MAG: hypothetical protein KatS3mg061_1796 [Dehalococcoidia bacterium]|nr:MAG: hypothetical protein KatS3mg061_1796 [Dehalococcoidia bacterium]
MACDRARVSAYRDGLLGPEEERAFSHHLARCSECRQTLALYDQIGQAIRSLPVVPAPPQLRPAVMTRIALARPSRQLAWRAFAAGFLSAAVVVLLLFAISRAFLTGEELLAGTDGRASEVHPLSSPTPAALVALASPTPSPPPTLPPLAPSPRPPLTSPPTEPSPRPPTVLPAATSTAPPSPDLTSPLATPSPLPASPTLPPATSTPLPLGPTPSPTPPPPGPTRPPATPPPSSTPRSVAEAPLSVVRAPLVTPTPGCPALTGRIGQTYTADPALPGKIGCPTGPAATFAGSEQTFQNGVMLRRDESRRVYVLAAGSWLTFLEPEGARTIAAPAPGEPPPPFLQTYRAHPALRILLGPAIGEPRPVQLTIQAFERATVLTTERRGLHVLYSDGRWELVAER